MNQSSHQIMHGLVHGLMHPDAAGLAGIDCRMQAYLIQLCQRVSCAGYGAMLSPMQKRGFEFAGDWMCGCQARLSWGLLFLVGGKRWQCMWLLFRSEVPGS